jgi:hypothetical protein
LYLLTNPETAQIGIYKITKKQIAFDLVYSIESVHALMERFTQHHKLIRYNSETREHAIKNWAKEEIRSLFGFFCGQEEMVFDREDRDHDEIYTYIEEDYEQLDDPGIRQCRTGCRCDFVLVP